MNKNDLIDALAPRLGGRAAAALAVESFVDVVLRQVADGGTVGITGFGTFEPVERAPRTGRNPHTGQAVPIPATRTPRFRPGTYFKAVVADPGELPDEGLAGARVGSSEDGATGAWTSGGAAPTDGSTGHRAGPAGRASAGPGTPASIRRPAGSRGAGPEAGGGPAAAAGRTTTARRRTGTPSTVRADRSPASPAPTAEPARGGGRADRLTIGGEQITREMITAKKAQLARAKGVQVAAEDQAGRHGRTGDGAETRGAKSRKDKQDKKEKQAKQDKKDKQGKKAGKKEGKKGQKKGQGAATA